MRFLAVLALSIVLLLMKTSTCLTIRKESVQNVLKDKTIDKTKSKKSVETLYSIENDFNRSNRYKQHGDGYEYYIPEKFIKPTVENVEEVHSVQQEDNEKYQNTLTYDAPPSQLLHQQQALRAGLAANPLLAALILGQTLGIPPAAAAVGGFNHPAHLPINPYIALLLSHYGRYVQPAAAIGRHQRGIYGYAAANNYHNNKPFGAYKIHEDAK